MIQASVFGIKEAQMGETLFPRQLDNDYEGFALAKWVLVVITVVTIVQSLIHLFAPE